MSLLNDALRKKRNEGQQSNGTLATSPPQPGITHSTNGRKPVRLAIAAILVLASVSCCAWLYWLAWDSPTEHTNTTFLAAAAELDNDTASTDSVAKPPAADTTPLQLTPPAATENASAPRQTPPKKKAPDAKPAQSISKSSTVVRAAPKPAKPKAASKAPAKAPQPDRPKERRQNTVKPDDLQRKLQSERLYRKARQYHRRNRLAQAIALYQEVIKTDPEHYNARFNLGAAFLETQSFDNAYYIMNDLYRKEPHNQQVMLNLAVAEIGRRRFDQALVLLDKAAEIPEPPQFEIALHKGIIFNNLNRAQDALDWYRRAEALRPDDPRLLFNLAVVADQQQRYAEAIDYYHRHIDQSPEINSANEKQIRRRIRVLQAYHTQRSPEESILR
jgi:tetratricopeptide (TPR) repeat protein